MSKNEPLTEKMLSDFERKLNGRELLPLDYRTHLLQHGRLEECWVDPSLQLKMYVNGNPKKFATHPVKLDDRVLGDLSPEFIGEDAYRESSGRIGVRPGVVYLMSGGCSISLFMVIRGPLKGYIFAENDGPTWFVCSNFSTFMRVMYLREVEKISWMSPAPISIST